MAPSYRQITDNEKARVVSLERRLAPALSAIRRAGAGAVGPTGPAGPTGATGATGPAGADGADGAPGADGADGADGTDGATWHTGSGVPSNALGVDADLYLRTNGDVYLKTSGAWSFVFSIIGPAGANGVDGSDGADGADGVATIVSYVEKTSTTSLTHTTEATADTIVTAGAFTPNGTDAYEIEFFCSEVVLSSGGVVRLYLYDGSTSLGEIATFYVGTAGVATGFQCIAKRRLVPSNASHTYSIRGTESGGSGSAQAGSGGSGARVPAYIKVTKIS